MADAADLAAIITEAHLARGIVAARRITPTAPPVECRWCHEERAPLERGLCQRCRDERA